MTAAEANKVPDPNQESPAYTALAEKAAWTRRLSIAAIYFAESGHPGGAMSCADILACLYGAEMNITADNLDDPNRDRFVLSKGHGAPALYAVASTIGLVEAKETLSLRKLGSPMQGHPHVEDLPWVETSTGSLGQGFSVAAGIALGLKHQTSDSRTYTLLGDGELQEGEVWEAAMFSAHYKLDNLCAVIDYNKMQSDDLNENIMGLEPLADKWRAFGWNAIEIDGHNINEILEALKEARTTKGRPTVIIAHTVKGKGVSYMENIPAWHGSVKLTDEDTETALADLGLDQDKIKEWMNGNVS